MSLQKGENGNMSNEGNKEVLKERFLEASREYGNLYNGMMELFADNPVMETLIRELHNKAHDYYMAMADIRESGYSVDFLLRAANTSETDTKKGNW